VRQPPTLYFAVKVALLALKAGERRVFMRMSRNFWELFTTLTVFWPALGAEIYVEKWTNSAVLGWFGFGVVGAVLLVLFNLIFFRDEFELPSGKEFIGEVFSLAAFPLVICSSILFMVLCWMVVGFSYMFIAKLWKELIAVFLAFLLLRFCIQLLLSKRRERQPKRYSAVVINKEIE